jgi:hypothetical protein
VAGAEGDSELSSFTCFGGVGGILGFPRCAAGSDGTRETAVRCARGQRPRTARQKTPSSQGKPSLVRPRRLPMGRLSWPPVSDGGFSTPFDRGIMLAHVKGRSRCTRLAGTSGSAGGTAGNVMRQTLDCRGSAPGLTIPSAARIPSAVGRCCLESPFGQDGVSPHCRTAPRSARLIRALDARDDSRVQHGGV